MKKLLLFPMLLASFSVFNLNAQITFTSTDLQESGKTYITKTDTITSVNLGTASATAQNWDFSTLLMHYMSGPSFDLTSNTPYDVDFPNSDLYTYGPAIMFGGFFGGAPVSEQGMNNGYMFWRKDITGFWTEGFMPDEGPYAGKKVYTVPQEMILGTPATLGTSHPNYSAWTLTFDQNATDVDTVYQSSVDKIQECDAWGTLTTPTGTYNDVLRIHESGVKVDSAKSYLNGNPLVFIEISRDTFNNYIFLTNGIHYPLALVKADKNNVIRSVEYYFMQGFLGTESVDKTTNVKIHPNPSDGLLTIELPMLTDEHSKMVITDPNGKTVGTFILYQQLNQIDCTQLNSGIYFYSVTSGAEQKFGKILIR